MAFRGIMDPSTATSLSDTRLTPRKRDAPALGSIDDRRFRYVWLAVGAALSLYAIHAKWDLALAAWVFPIFLLRFSRASRTWVAIGWMWSVAAADVLCWLFQADLYSPTMDHQYAG